MSVCPFNIITGYTLFVEDEDKGVNAILTRSDMEAHMVRALRPPTLALLPAPPRHQQHIC